MRNRLLLAVIGILLQPLTVWAADPTPQQSTDLQNQLKQLQQSISQSSGGGSTVTTNVTTTQTAPNQMQAFTQNVAPNTNVPVNAQGQPLAPGSAAAANAQLAAQMGQAAPGSGQPNESLDLRDEAFAKMTATTLPMTPAQIQMLRALYDTVQKSSATYPGVPPKPTTSSIPVDLSPGATPPIVRLGAGFVTSLVFVDATGAPWPIESLSVGNPTAFNVQWDKKSNILLVQAITAYRTANLAVILKGLNTPVMIDLKPGQAAMDVRVDLRIPSLGPNAKPMVSGLPSTGSPYLISLLDGIPPPGSRSLKTTGCDNCAWLLDGKLYLRTEYTVLSPAWVSTMSSADGTHVYEMSPTPLVLASYNGKVIKLNIEGY